MKSITVISTMLTSRKFIIYLYSYFITNNSINLSSRTLPWEKIKLLVKVANLAGNDRVIGDVLNYDEAPAVDGTLDERSLVRRNRNFYF